MTSTLSLSTNFFHVPLPFFNPLFPERRKKNSSFPNSSHTLTDFRYSHSHNHLPPSLPIFPATHPHLNHHHTSTSTAIHLLLPPHPDFPLPPPMTTNSSHLTTSSSRHCSPIPHHQSLTFQNTCHFLTHHSNISQLKTSSTAFIKTTTLLRLPYTFEQLMSTLTQNFSKNTCSHSTSPTHSSPCSMSNHSTPH